ncbi:MAG: penicillin-binding protein 1C [Saprospiraceae bacterium]
MFVLSILLVWFYFCLPDPLFSDPYSTVLNDDKGQLIGAKISADGQWRFPLIDSVPQNFEEAIVTFEDKRFRSHIGVDVLSLGRALIQNIKAGKIESGASTLSMQVIRMSRKGKSRTISQKIIEMILAVRLELRYSKVEILQLYSSHAPFGGNVVGLEAASWRYYKKHPSKLSVSEAAMLAVLPNAPSLIHISKNRSRLLTKRNRLLYTMKDENLISKENVDLYVLEKIPPKPYPLPSIASHLLEYVHKIDPEKIVNSTIDYDIQQMTYEIGSYHHQINAQSDIHNLGIIVLDTRTGEVKAYLGNAPNTNQESAVDMIQAKRSSGSVLKPILYAHMIDEGKMMPQALLKDIPTQIRGFNPKNYNRKYTGATPADKALAMSLNIPAVYTLQDYGVEPFIHKLQDHGFTTINKSSDHYGLSLILGGGEVTLWNLCGAYASLGQTLIEFNNNDGKYNILPNETPSISSNKMRQKTYSREPINLSAGSIFKTFEAMLKVIRPGADGQWEQFNSSKPIAWKTGTSYGHRDAWAIGVSPNYTVGIWVGNADGEGKNSLVGVSKAGPILFDIFNRLDSGVSFKEPVDDLVPILTCSKSGYLLSSYCESVDTIFSVVQGQKSNTCPYHRLIHMDRSGYQVSSICIAPSKMKHINWFELPSSMAYYYRKKHPEYKTTPPFRKDCIQDVSSDIMSFIYPTERSKIYLPTDIDGIQQKAIFKAAHQNPNGILYWHIDNSYLGYTQEFHNMEINATTGPHMITIVDEDGNQVKQSFEVVN